jgi:hypothetical protein
MITNKRIIFGVVRRRHVAVAAVVLSGMFLICAGSARAATIDLTTGLDGAGNLITTGGVSDANWWVDQPSGGIAPAVVVTPNDGDWWGPWRANGPSSDWIAYSTAKLQPAASYSFYRYLDLTGYDLNTITLTGTINYDDTANILTGLPPTMKASVTPQTKRSLFPSVTRRTSCRGSTL